MDGQLNKSIYTGITIDEGSGDDETVVVVTGPDCDAVFESALNVKNAMPVESCPQVEGPYRNIETGAWRAVIRLRREEA